MPISSCLVPATNLRPADIESQQGIRTTPRPQNKVVKIAKVGAIAAMCAATSGLLLADLARVHDITLPIQHAPGRELLDLAVNGTCPEGQHLVYKEHDMTRATTMLAIFGIAPPGLTILSGVGMALFRDFDQSIYVFGTIGGVSLGATVFCTTPAIMGYVAMRNTNVSTCQPNV